MTACVLLAGFPTTEEAHPLDELEVIDPVSFESLVPHGERLFQNTEKEAGTKDDEYGRLSIMVTMKDDYAKLYVVNRYDKDVYPIYKEGKELRFLTETLDGEPYVPIYTGPVSLNSIYFTYKVSKDYCVEYFALQDNSSFEDLVYSVENVEQNAACDF